MERYLKHDVQCETEGFKKIDIDKVGVRKIMMPISIIRKNGELFNSIAHISAYCNLDKLKKGINMSRNARTLFEDLANTPLQLNTLDDTVKKLAKVHNTNSINLKLWFEYIYELESPVTKILSYEPCYVKADVSYYNGKCKTNLKVTTNESSCCPCSKNMSMLKNILTFKEIEKLADTLDLSTYNKIMGSGYGAHNQRSEIAITVTLNKNNSELMWIEDILNIAKNGSSAPTYNVLKREDEKHVTENQYNNPKFVEDIARDIAHDLNKELDNRIIDWLVVVDNDESIHSSLIATAIISAGRSLN